VKDNRCCCGKGDENDLANARDTVVRITNCHEKTRQAYFQDVDTGEKLFQSRWIKLTTCVILGY